MLRVSNGPMARPAGTSLLLLALSCSHLSAQSPQEIVEQAVQTELTASHNDHTLWRYRQEEKVPVNTVYLVSDSAQGTIKRKIEQNGQPLTPEQAAAEQRRIDSFVHDPGAQQKQKRNDEHDSESAEKLLRMLPKAFTWKIVGESPDTITLEFAPDPEFRADGMEARVMSAMGGQLVVDKTQHRIRSIRGKLGSDVTIGYGLLGRLHEGGTFSVERRELAPGLWQITETHVHIDGRALLFKSISEQQDEINTSYTQLPAGTTIEQAASALAAH